MHIHFLDPYRPRQSPIHRLDPRVKFILTVAFILTVSLSPPGAWPIYILLLAIILAVEMLSDLGVGYVLKRANLEHSLIDGNYELLIDGAQIVRVGGGPSMDGTFTYDVPAVLGVYLFDGETVQWNWTHTAEGSYVSGYQIDVERRDGPVGS